MHTRLARSVGGGLLAVLFYLFMSAVGAPAAIISYLLVAFVACSSLAFLLQLVTRRIKNAAYHKQQRSLPVRFSPIQPDSFAAYLLRRMWRALDTVGNSDTRGTHPRAERPALETKWFKPRPKKQVAVARVEDREGLPYYLTAVEEV